MLPIAYGDNRSACSRGDKVPLLQSHRNVFTPPGSLLGKKTLSCIFPLQSYSSCCSFGDFLNHYLLGHSGPWCSCCTPPPPPSSSTSLYKTDNATVDAPWHLCIRSLTEKVAAVLARRCSCCFNVFILSGSPGRSKRVRTAPFFNLKMRPWPRFALKSQHLDTSVRLAVLGGFTPPQGLK